MGKFEKVVQMPDSNVASAQIKPHPTFTDLDELAIETMTSEFWNFPTSEDLDVIVDSKYHSEITKQRLEGEKEARKKLDQAAQNYTGLSGCDDGLPAPTDSPASSPESSFNKLLTNPDK